MKSVLITGGAGFIGSVLTQELLKSGYAVTVLDNFRYNQLSLLSECNSKHLELIKGDVNEILELQKLVKLHDVIIPLAAIVGAPACDKYEDLAIKTNFSQIVAIVDAMRPGQELIMPNTNSQYGSSDSIITEESEFKPLSLYARTKCDAEDYIMMNGNGICLRLATVFGASPRMRIDLLVNDFVYRAMKDGFLVLYESHFKRNYIHVRDVARTFLFCVEHYDDMKGDVFNVGQTTANLTKRELALKIKEFIPSLVIIENNFAKDLDQRNYLVSNEKLESKGWKPEYTIEDGIEELIKASEMLINGTNKLFTNL